MARVRFYVSGCGIGTVSIIDRDTDIYYLEDEYFEVDQKGGLQLCDIDLEEGTKLQITYNLYGNYYPACFYCNVDDEVEAQEIEQNINIKVGSEDNLSLRLDCFYFNIIDNYETTEAEWVMYNFSDYEPTYKHYNSLHEIQREQSLGSGFVTSATLSLPKGVMLIPGLCYELELFLNYNTVTIKNALNSPPGRLKIQSYNKTIENDNDIIEGVVGLESEEITYIYGFKVELRETYTAKLIDSSKTIKIDNIITEFDFEETYDFSFEYPKNELNSETKYQLVVVTYGDKYSGNSRLSSKTTCNFISRPETWVWSDQIIQRGQTYIFPYGEGYDGKTIYPVRASEWLAFIERIKEFVRHTGINFTFIENNDVDVYPKGAFTKAMLLESMQALYDCADEQNSAHPLSKYLTTSTIYLEPQIFEDLAAATSEKYIT